MSASHFLRSIGLSTLISAVCAAATIQITSDSVNQDWGTRNTPTSQGFVLWTDGDHVYFWDGNTNTPIQQRDNNVDALSGGVDTGTVFSLGTDVTAGKVVGAWRRGNNGDYAWTWRNTPDSAGTSVEIIDPTNPFDANARHNPEGVGVAGGCVYMIFQAFYNANAVKHAFAVNPLTGTTTNLSGTDPIQGVSRIVTNQCEAVYLLSPDDLDNPNDDPPVQLWYYNGVTPVIVDFGEINSLPSFANGIIVYSKVFNGVSQVFMFDTDTVSPAVSQVTTDTTLHNFSPQTDGYHLAWLRGQGDQSDLHIVLLGDVQLTDTATQPSLAINNTEEEMQLERGQILWFDVDGNMRYDAGTGRTYNGFVSVPPIDRAPSTSLSKAWLADGHIAWLGLSEDLGVDVEAFVYAGTTPRSENELPPPFLVLAEPGNGEATVKWDSILRADSYNVYYAAEPGVTPANYGTLRGGTRLADTTSPTLLTPLLNNQPYYVVVTTVRDGVESDPSREAVVTPFGHIFIGAPELSGLTMRAVAANPTNPDMAVAAGSTDVYVSSDGGQSWAGPAKSDITGRAVRALAAHGQRVLAATQDGDMLRSDDGGTTWSVVADGSDIGEIYKSLIIDPANPDVAYAGNFQLSTYDAGVDAYVIKSTNGGQSWDHVNEFSGGELRAYALAIAPDGSLFAGGAGTPELAVSANGGAAWDSRSIPGLNSVYALSLEAASSSILYAGVNGLTFPQVNGVFKTTDAGTTWTQMAAGLPDPLGQIYTVLADPGQPPKVYAGGDDGLFFSPDGGEHWIPRNEGFPAKAVPGVYALAMTSKRALLAATTQGLFVLNLSIPNVAPEIEPVADRITDEGQPDSLAVAASDYEGDTLTFSALGLPPGFSINSSTGQISGTAQVGSADFYNAEVVVSDGEFEASGGFGWTINGPPVITNPGNRVNNSGDVINLEIDGGDPNFDTLSWSALNLPPELAMAPATGVISGTIVPGTSGDFSVELRATDGRLVASETFVWTVNNAPTIDNPGNQTSDEGEVVNLAISANDSEGDTLTFSAAGLPNGLAINIATGVVSGTVAAGASGDYTPTLSVSDGVLNDDVTFAWHINGPPLVVSPGAQNSEEGDAVTLPVAATDPNGDALTYNAIGLPAGLSIGTATGLISGTIEAGAAGQHQVTIQASDGRLEGQATFTWSVRPEGVAPVPGDIDGNLEVDAVDVQLVVNAALDIDSEFDEDVDCDGDVDAVDVQLVINAALGIEIASCP